jgi:hypothetical protein
MNTQAFKHVFKETAHLIVQLEKDTDSARKELIANGCAFYVYFETPFQFRYFGFTHEKSAKAQHKKILNANRDLYGCVVAVCGVY